MKGTVTGLESLVAMRNKQYSSLGSGKRQLRFFLVRVFDEKISGLPEFQPAIAVTLLSIS